jgi:hypothetical protein
MATMARDSISNPAVIKTIVLETFYEPDHSQNNGAYKPGKSTDFLYCLN